MVRDDPPKVAAWVGNRPDGWEFLVEEGKMGGGIYLSLSQGLCL